MKAEELKSQPFKGLIDISNKLGQFEGSEVDYAIEDVVFGDNSDAVKGILTVIRNGKGILIKGKATVQVELMCNRCLNEFVQAISFDIEEEVYNQNSKISETTIFDDEDAIYIKEQNMLDIGELIRQYTLINLPMKALCKSDCNINKEVNNYGPS